MQQPKLGMALFALHLARLALEDMGDETNLTDREILGIIWSIEMLESVLLGESIGRVAMPEAGTIEEARATLDALEERAMTACRWDPPRLWGAQG